MEFIKNLFLNYIPAVFILWLIFSYFFQKPKPETPELSLNQLSAEQTVTQFATEFLDSDAQDRIKTPLQSEYEALFDLEGTEISPLLWGEILIEEIYTINEFGQFLDWKYNVLTLILDDDPESNILSHLFEANGLDPVSDDERKAILNIAYKKYGKRPKKLMLPMLQELAVKRGHRLLVIDNYSDMFILISLPIEQAEKWHLAHIGDTLFVDAAHPIIDDPRSSKKNQMIFD